MMETGMFTTVTIKWGGIKMTNEEFQRIVLQKLDNLEEGQRRLEERQQRLEEGQQRLEERQQRLEERQQRLEERQQRLEERQEALEGGQRRLEERVSNLERTVNAIYEQTAILTEFREEVNQKFDGMLAQINTLEIVTSKNWNDIARLKAAK